jgi:anion-transporting  ArsA/GET3 family ATPase
MLDAKQTFDALVMRLVPDVDRAQRLLDSRYYRYVSTHLVGVHEYMAMERVTALVDESDYDIVVLDTPPTRHAVSFLTAPERMIAVMDERVLGALAKARSPRGYQTLQRSAELVMSVLDKMAGAATLREIGEFMGAIQEMGLSFRERADRTRALLRGPSAYFLIVTTAAATARFEAIELLGFLDAFGFQVGGIVLNRCVFPPSCGLSPSTGDLVRPDGVSAADWQAALDIVSQAPDHFHALARADAVAIEQLHADTSHNCKLFTVPRLADEIHDLSSLDRMAQWLPLPGDLDHGPDPET